MHIWFIVKLSKLIKFKQVTQFTFFKLVTQVRQYIYTFTQVLLVMHFTQ